MSMWQLAKGAASDFKNRGFRSWPDPTAGFVKDIEVLACQDTFQAKVTMYGMAAAHWFWTNFIPSPVEITRKTLVGGYKCGFYLGLKWGSPIDTVFRAPGLSQMLLEISRPAVTGLFYLWAFDTLYSGLQTWQSLVYAGLMCDTDHSECVLANGVGNYYAGGAYNGTPNAYDTLQDPTDMYTSPGGDVVTFAPGYLRLDAFGTVYAGSAPVTHCAIGFYKGTDPLNGQGAQLNVGAISAGNSSEFAISWAGYVDAGSFRVNGDLLNEATGLQHSDIVVHRWTASWAPEPWQNNCPHWTPADP